MDQLTAKELIIRNLGNNSRLAGNEATSGNDGVVCYKIGSQTAKAGKIKDILDKLQFHNLINQINQWFWCKR